MVDPGRFSNSDLVTFKKRPVLVVQADDAPTDLPDGSSLVSRRMSAAQDRPASPSVVRVLKAKLWVSSPTRS